jgi:hypothetical protein
MADVYPEYSVHVRLPWVSEHDGEDLDWIIRT